AGRLGQERTGGDRVSLVDLDIGLFGQIVEVEDLAAFVLDDDLRMEVPLVLDDHPANVAAGVFFVTGRFPLDHVLEPNLAGHLGEDRDAVGGPLAEDLADLDLLIFLDRQNGAGRDFVFLQLAPLGIEDQDFAVAGEHDLLAGVVAHDLEAGKLDDAGFLGPAFVLDDRALADAADVERAHRELGAWLADALGADDADGHPFL